MKIRTKKFLVHHEEAVDLKKRPTRVAPAYTSKREYEEMLAAHVGELSRRQQLFNSFSRYSLLLVFQGMDAAGKDGIIRHVMSGVNPQGCEVVSFKEPSAVELRHDFLWRAACRLPERGRIGIFNRSYYEEVLVVRAHKVLLSAQDLPEELTDPAKIWEDRYRSMVEFERHLHRNGTRVLKFFLHLSKGEQRRRLLERIDNPEKNWKFSLADVRERQYWAEYTKCYEKCLGATSTKRAPWYVVPADDKENARLIVSSVILDCMEDLNLTMPKITGARRRELQSIRKKLAGKDSR